MDYPILIYDENSNNYSIIIRNSFHTGQINMSNPVNALCLLFDLLDYSLSCIGQGYEMGYMDAKEEDEEEYEGLMQGRNPLHFYFIFQKSIDILDSM